MGSIVQIYFQVISRVTLNANNFSLWDNLSDYSLFTPHRNCIIFLISTNCSCFSVCCFLLQFVPSDIVRIEGCRWELLRNFIISQHTHVLRKCNQKWCDYVTALKAVPGRRKVIVVRYTSFQKTGGTYHRLDLWVWLPLRYATTVSQSMLCCHLEGDDRL